VKRSEIKRRRSIPMRQRGVNRGRDLLWLAARDRTLERDHYWPTCHQLGLTGECAGGVEVHHKLRRSQGGTHELDNLATLCAAHHRWVHEHPAQAYELGLLIRSGAA
jgi:hypothetical protein